MPSRAWFRRPGSRGSRRQVERRYLQATGHGHGPRGELVRRADFGVRPWIGWATTGSGSDTTTGYFRGFFYRSGGAVDS